MKLKIQKRLAAQVLKCSEKRVKFDNDRLEDIKEAITKGDIRSLVNTKAIIKKPIKGTSKVRARKQKMQKLKGRRRGPGSRKGKSTARLPKKQAWMNKVRIQRQFIKLLREKGALDKTNYNKIYLKIKGGFFRSKRHIKLYLTEHSLIKDEKKR